MTLNDMWRNNQYSNIVKELGYTVDPELSFSTTEWLTPNQVRALQGLEPVKNYELSMEKENKMKNDFMSIHTSIQKVIFNDPATIVYWMDGTKTVVKCYKEDVFDPEKGLAMAIVKKSLGNTGNHHHIFKKWIPEEKKKPVKLSDTLYPGVSLENLFDAIGKVSRTLNGKR